MEEGLRRRIVIGALACGLSWSTTEGLAATVRQPLRLEGEPAPAAAPQALKIGRESRPIFALSGRRLLSVGPAEVGPSGKLFAFGKVPGDRKVTEVVGEVLVWELPHPVAAPDGSRRGGWRRLALVPYRGGVGGHLSLTTVEPSLDAGTVVVGVFLRAPEIPSERVVRSLPLELPHKARLRFAYGIDELDTRGLAPVVVSVAALVTQAKAEQPERVELYTREIDVAGKDPFWWEGSVDIAKLGGEKAVFEFASRTAGTAKELRSHVAWSMPVILSQARETPPPSVILVSLGEFGVDSLGCYGASEGPSPFLDALFGKQGVIFERAYDETFGIISGHMSLLTGTSTCRHRVRSAARQLAPEISTLAERFSDAGFITAAFTDGAGMVPEIGFGRGFDVYLELADAAAVDSVRHARTPFEVAIHWLATHEDEPVFLFVHASQSYRYGGRELDEVLREFVGKADEVVDSDRSIWVVTSGGGREGVVATPGGDGEKFSSLSRRIPLLMRGEGLARGARVSESVRLVDIAPTLLGLAGVEPPPELDGRALGESLRKRLPFPAAPTDVDCAAEAVRAEAPPTGFYITPDSRLRLRALGYQD